MGSDPGKDKHEHDYKPAGYDAAIGKTRMVCSCGAEVWEMGRR